MWILLREKLPTNQSPPKLSIFWSKPWVDKKIAERQLSDLVSLNDDFGFENETIIDPTDDYVFFNQPSILAKTVTTFTINGKNYKESYVKEHNWLGARAIEYKEEKIRVFPNEFSIISDNMFEEIHDGYEFILDDNFQQRFMSDGEFKQFMEVVSLDTDNIALQILTAMGATGSKRWLPGWFKPNQDLLNTFCTEYEQRG